MAEQPENVDAEDETTEAAEGASAAEATPSAPVAEQQEPVAVVAPKERKRAAKAAKAPAVRAPVSPEERQAERVVERRRKASVRGPGRVKAREKARAVEHRTEPTPPREHPPGTQKERQGIVLSDKADKTITVRIDLTRRHRKYQKIVATSRTLHAHDEANDAHIGDTVLVRECRPLSRSKRWRLIDVLERAK